MVEKNNTRLTANEFALVLSNDDLQDNFFLEVSQSVDKIEDKFNSKQDFCWLNIRYVKKVNLFGDALKISTSIFAFAEEIADAMHEVLPRHGIAVIPWSAYSA